MDKYTIDEKIARGYKELYELAEKKIFNVSKISGITAFILLIITYTIDLKTMYICFGILCFSPLTIPIILDVNLKKAKKELKYKYPHIEDIDSFSKLEFLMQEYDKALEGKEEIKEETVEKINEQVVYDEPKDLESFEESTEQREKVKTLGTKKYDRY